MFFDGAKWIFGEKTSSAGLEAEQDFSDTSYLESVEIPEQGTLRCPYRGFVHWEEGFSVACGKVGIKTNVRQETGEPISQATATYKYYQNGQFVDFAFKVPLGTHGEIVKPVGNGTYSVLIEASGFPSQEKEVVVNKYCTSNRNCIFEQNVKMSPLQSFTPPTTLTSATSIPTTLTTSTSTASTTSTLNTITTTSFPITKSSLSQNTFENLKTQAEAKLKSIKPVVGANGKEIFYFDEYVETPQGSFGMLGLDRAYKRIFAQDNGTGVGVGMGIISVTNINSRGVQNTPTFGMN